jgi:hypothetical protein
MRFFANRTLPLLVVSAVLLGAPRPVHAQGPGCTVSGGPSVSAMSRELAQLPVDRIADLLALEPGVTSLNDGDLSVRGAGVNATSAYLDGISVTPGHRGTSPLLGGSYFGALGSGIGIGTNGFERVTLYRGATSAELGGGRGGAIAVSTGPRCDADTGWTRPSLAGGWATDALFGKRNGLGFNRLTLNGDGRAGRFSLGGAAVVEGLSTARLGLEQNDSPVFVLDGLDTTVTFDPGGGAVSVDVARFRPSQGIRIPSSANASYTLGARLGYELGAGQRLRLAAYASQRQHRVFDYQALYDPRQARADRAWSRAFIGSWFGRLKSNEVLALQGEAHLSWQTDRLMEGPLSASGERSSRDPFGGFLVSPVGFRFDFDNFAVNDALIHNFRTNTGRRSPYDLDNTSQYALIDQYRNNAYGVTGFIEGGGPVGQLTLSREDRVVGKAALEATFEGQHHIRVGVELTRYDIDFFQSGLTTQSQSNAYIESPTRTAVFGDYALSIGPAEVIAGVRYERFASGASRPEFPRISSFPIDTSNPTAGFIKDKSHGRLSPGLRASYRATSRLTLYGSLAGLAQAPDFAAVLAGINTDLSVTNVSQVFGSDLGFEHATVWEIGGRYLLLPDLSGEASLWHRKDDDLVNARLVDEFDPLKGFNQSIRRYRNAGSLSATGLELKLSRRLGERGQAWLGYSYANPTQEAAGPFGGSIDDPVNDARPHTVAGGVLYNTGEASRLFGGVLRNLGIYGTARIASGTAYTRCPIEVPEDDGVLSGGLCSRRIDGDLNGSRLPALKLVDLRLTRDVTIGPTRLVAFVDARNLFNSRNVTRVFAQTGTTSNSTERAKLRLGQLDEFANEAQANGAGLPDGSIDLSFGGVADPRAACGSWTNSAGTPTVPNCIYLLAAEQRWGNGDHIFSTAEQTRASDALYEVARGLQNFTGPGRRVRIGLELRL